MYSSAQNFTNLVEAAKINDLATVRDLMWACNPKERNSLPFVTAAQYGSLECLEALKNVSDVTAQDAQALLMAVKFGHLACVKFLWNRSIPSLNKRGDLALVYAAMFGQKKIVEYILEKGADPKYKGSMALFKAVLEGKHDIVQLLYPLSEPHKALSTLKFQHKNERDKWQWFEDMLDAKAQHIVIAHEIQPYGQMRTTRKM